MKKLTVAILSVMVCGLVVLSACGSGSSGSSAADDSPLGCVPGIFVEVAHKKEVLDSILREERDIKRHQKRLKEFDEYAAESYRKAAEEGKN